MALTSALQHHQLLTAESEGIWLEKEKLKEKLKALQFKYDQMEIAMDSTVPVDQHDALNVQLSVLRPLLSLTWAPLMYSRVIHAKIAMDIFDYSKTDLISRLPS